MSPLFRKIVERLFQGQLTWLIAEETDIEATHCYNIAVLHEAMYKKQGSEEGAEAARYIGNSIHARIATLDQAMQTIRERREEYEKMIARVNPPKWLHVDPETGDTFYIGGDVE